MYLRLFFVYSGAVSAPLVFCLDPNRDPNAEKSRWIQADTMDVLLSRKCAKGAESAGQQRFPALIVSSHAGGHWFESSSLHQTLEIAMISRVFSCYQKMIVFCFTVLSLYFLSKLIVFYRNEKETLSRLFFHYLSCTFLPLMWSMLMRNIWTALPEAATSSSTIFSVG